MNVGNVPMNVKFLRKTIPVENGGGPNLPSEPTDANIGNEPAELLKRLTGNADVLFSVKNAGKMVTTLSGQRSCTSAVHGKTLPWKDSERFRKPR